MTLRRLPAFASEEEEANWWYDNREKHDEEFAKAFDEGRVKRGSISQRIEAAKKATAISLNAEDALKAVLIAQEKGMDVQAYLSALIHTALKSDLNAVSQNMDDAPKAHAAHSEKNDVPELLQR